jgi:hypothetical protein
MTKISKPPSCNHTFMSLSEESNGTYSERKKQFDRFKRDTPIGIFGSFYPSRKLQLLSLKEFLLHAGYHPRISEDLDRRKGKDRKRRDPVVDRNLSERLIAESDIHIFVMVQARESEPENLIQSVSMEIERLHTLDDCGQKSANYVAVYAERGLTGKMGSVCEGLLVSKNGDWYVGEFDQIPEIFRPARQFCMNCIQDMYGF